MSFARSQGFVHPQIARAHDFGYTDGERLPFYTREYIEEVPLPPGPPSGTDRSGPQAFLKPILDFLDALYALHAQGVLHLVLGQGRAVLAIGHVKAFQGLVHFGGRRAGDQ